MNANGGASFAHSPGYRLALWTLREVCAELSRRDPGTAGSAEATPRATLSDEQLDRLAYHFGDNLLTSALELVDKRSVTLVLSASSSSDRQLHRVAGSTGAVYYCLKERLYCGCPSHKLGVVRRADHCLCKHCLALHLSDALGLTAEETVTEQQLDGMMQHI